MAKGLGITEIMNKESMASSFASHKVTYIDIQKIQEHEKNRVFDSQRIEGLARDIEDLGLQEPIIVTPAGQDSYLLLSGHRRLAAFKLLAAEKKDFQVIPAIVRKDIDADRIEELLIGGNLFNEELTDAEKARELARKKELLQKRKAAGEKIAGKVLDIIAAELGINEEAARRMDRVNRSAEPEVKQQFETGEISLREAYKVSKLTPEEQRELIEKKVSGEIEYLFPEKKHGVHVPHKPTVDDSSRGVHVPLDQPVIITPSSTDLSPEDAAFKASVDYKEVMRHLEDLMAWAKEWGLSEQSKQYLYIAHAEMAKFQFKNCAQFLEAERKCNK